jgi:hypothetical protein
VLPPSSIADGVLGLDEASPDDMSAEINRLFTCDPKSTLKVIQQGNAKGGRMAYDEVDSIPSLGSTCAAASNWEQCFLFNTHGLPMSMDYQVPLQLEVQHCPHATPPPRGGRGNHHYKAPGCCLPALHGPATTPKVTQLTQPLAATLLLLSLLTPMPCPYWSQIQISNAIDAFVGKTQALYNEAIKQAAVIVNVGSRVAAAGKSTIGLFPITLALLPGLAKGAVKVKSILPQSALVSYVLVIVPPLQLPLLACILCVIVQLGGLWFVFVGERPPLARTAANPPPSAPLRGASTCTAPCAS